MFPFLSEPTSESSSLLNLAPRTHLDLLVRVPNRMWFTTTLHGHLERSFIEAGELIWKEGGIKKAAELRRQLH